MNIRGGNNMRKLATVRKISNIRPIENADAIEVCSIDGWNVVIKKGIHKEGDLAVYIEVDSLLDENNPVFEFMRPRGFKVKTIKLRGQISQGLIIPLKEFEDILIIHQLAEGDDLTKILKISKFEVDDDLLEAQEVKEDEKGFKRMLIRKIRKMLGIKKTDKKKYGAKGFPTHLVSKTDEKRVQNFSKSITPDKSFIVTEKLDGTSATYVLEKKKGFFKPKYEFYICSRNLRISENDVTSKYVKIAKKYGIRERLMEMMEHENKKMKECVISLQGEIVGQGIQKNRYEKELEFYAFTLTKNGVRENFCDSLDLLWKYDGEFPTIKQVPIISSSHRFSSGEDVVNKSNMKSLLNPRTIAEGIVIRNVKDLSESYKAINPEFLLKNKL
jgi:hypothetical protein